MLIDASIHRIRSYADHMGWSARQYGAAAKVPESTVRDVLKGRGNPTAETLRAMEAVIPSRFRPKGSAVIPAPPAAHRGAAA